MKDDINVLINWVYRHFKGGFYYVDDVAIDEDTNEKVVIYRKFDDETGKPVGDKYIRKASVFTEMIINKYDDNTNITNQIYRFEPMIISRKWQKKKKKKKERNIVWSFDLLHANNLINQYPDWEITHVCMNNDRIIFVLEKEIEEDE